VQFFEEFIRNQGFRQENGKPYFAEFLVGNLRPQQPLDMAVELVRADAAGLELPHQAVGGKPRADLLGRQPATARHLLVAAPEIERHNHPAQVENQRADHFPIVTAASAGRAPRAASRSTADRPPA